MATTQKQIAQHLGLSQPIVAQALNGHPGVAEKTRQRVQDAAREMGYSLYSNTAARSLRAQRHGKRPKTGVIAVLMGDLMDGVPLQQMPFFRELLQGIHNEAAQHHLDVAIYVANPASLPRTVTEHTADGAICLYAGKVSRALDKAEVSTPVVRLGGDSENWNLRPDDWRGTYLATRHLLELGHRNIAYLGNLDECAERVSLSERRRGYTEALKAAGVPLDESLMQQLPQMSQQSGYENMRALLQRTRDFSAVVCVNDAAAMGAIAAAREAGLEVPRDLSVTGFDGAEEGYGGSELLSTIRFDRRIMGRRAVRWLIEWQGEMPAEPQQKILPVRLLTRHTTQPPQQ